MFKVSDTEYLTVDDLENFGFHKEVQRSWRKRRLIPHRRVGKKILYRQEDFLAFIEQHRIESVDELRDRMGR